MVFIPQRFTKIAFVKWKISILKNQQLFLGQNLHLLWIKQNEETFRDAYLVLRVEAAYLPIEPLRLVLFRFQTYFLQVKLYAPVFWTTIGLENSNMNSEPRLRERNSRYVEKNEKVEVTGIRQASGEWVWVQSLRWLKTGHPFWQALTCRCPALSLTVYLLRHLLFHFQAPKIFQLRAAQHPHQLTVYSDLINP